MNRRNRFVGALGVAAVVLLGLAASVSCSDDNDAASTGSGDLAAIARNAI